MKQWFKDIKFKPESEARITQCNVIIADYQSQGLTLTLRQLYYQLVSANVIPNEERSYKNLGNLVADARLAGLMDWEAIEDRGRVPRIPADWDNLEDLVDGALRSYRLPRWKGQPNYVELWVEKDALAGVLRPIASEYHVTMMANKGYSSASAMYESSLRFLANHEGEDEDGGTYYKDMTLLYLGDMDPSGEDMVRDIRDRMDMFGVNVDVQKIALTMAQVKQYKPPPNPAKVTDSRAAAYIEKHGNSSWEVDALPPNILAKLIRKELDLLVDKTMMNAIKEKEKRDKALLRETVKGLTTP